MKPPKPMYVVSEVSLLPTAGGKQTHLRHFLKRGAEMHRVPAASKSEDISDVTAPTSVKRFL